MNNPAYRDVSLPEEVGGCLLCAGAPCRKACPYGVAADTIIRSLRFENFSGAANRLPEPVPCASCATKDCLSACLKGKMSRPVPVDEIMLTASTYDRLSSEDTDLSIDFCGVRCENPFFLSSSVVGSNYEMVAKAFEMGWAGVAFKTIGTFAANEVSPRFDALTKESVPFVGFKNIEQISEHPLNENLAYLRQLKKDFPTKVIVASIMGQDEAEWTYLAEVMTAAGADILECNFSCPHMAANGLGSDVGQNPELVAAYTRATRRGTHLPILAKMTPNIGNMELPAIAAIEAGATGIAAINTIKSIMNVNLDTFASGPDVQGRTSVGGYSGKAVKPIALRFIQAMKSCDKLAGVPVSGMGGIETWRDAAEFMALGCENIQVTTSVMQYGYRIIEDMIEGMRLYLAARGYKSVGEIVGRALPNILPAEALDRDSICYPRFDRSKCVGCGRCCLSCYDGGHQALRQDDKTGRPVMDARRCVGCHLCVAVCPAGAVSPGVRVTKDRIISNVG
ncbi:dihydropyrimidine dehydrogenase (NAD+) subunit PreA [Sporobacter termitidis DSM 10068]|uniref:Dihydroorotate dehydrogenase B (NAD(+)), catalytic subunit n=1 Tax=Sporobacter termitidis DSM 10068 TaxID=1123282 RepID=A0A1M5YLG7_9FIRM|nr:NAD-dependent dihydropyrimidine dehydrogenase subunit PreA [Sporobacter termitidis]SHI12383.1 dihydropyrimidine dehydrogenase (NAD+) subunit PreA [Sporobacter termitidis DSM 10068]